MPDRAFIERVWYGHGPAAAIARAALLPFERAYGAVVGARDILYDAGWLPAQHTPIRAVSVGNLSVGGTGKTPVAAWIARELVERGARPAVVLRGYGADEPLVHRILNPSIPVVVNADRAAGVARAAQLGADVAVMDDAFQHRRVRRVSDLVLVSADRWTSNHRLLPAGPWREPLRALRRASMIIVTRKAVPESAVDEVHAALAAVNARVPRVGLRLAPSGLVEVGGADTRPLDALAGRRVHVITAIGDAPSFLAQLRAAGAEVTATTFRDHHRFTARDIAHAVIAVPADGWALCTLKDAVKLQGRWPRHGAPLWYVSQQVIVERGVGGLERLLDDLVRARFQTSPTAG